MPTLQTEGLALSAAETGTPRVVVLTGRLDAKS
ncbi:MAG: hypothetical protein RIS45_1357, partial [Planctomycetota bacterium]